MGTPHANQFEMDLQGGPNIKTFTPKIYIFITSIVFDDVFYLIGRLFINACIKLKGNRVAVDI